MKGLYSEAVIIATILTVLLLLVAWLILTIAGPVGFSLVFAVVFWRVVFVWCMDT